MVGDGENTIKTIGRWEFNDEVHGNILEGKGSVVSGDGAVGSAGVGHKRFGGLAGGASTDEGGNEVLYMGPPVVFCKEETSFQNSRVTRCGGVMIEGGHSPSKGVVCHNNKVGAISPRAIGPLGERVCVGPLREERGMGGLSGNDGGIEVCGGHGIEKEGIWEGKDMFVIMGAGVVVWATREGVCVIRCPWFMDEADIIVTKCYS